jgi:hypothetical protein
MKNLIKFLTVLFFLSTTIFTSAQFAVGPKLGINFSTVGGDDIEKEDKDMLKSLVTYQFGLSAEFSINENFAIQPELLYYQKGFALDDSKSEEVTEAKQILNYLELPVLAKAIIPVGNGPEFFITAGPSVGYGINGKVKYNGEEEDIDFDEDNIRRFDFSVSFGAGAQFPVSTGKVFIDARYLLGLSPLSDYEDPADVKNRGYAIAAGFLFPIGGN